MHLLLKMGFPREAIKKALFFTFNQGIDQATKWLLDHITDHNYAEPFVPSRRSFNKGKINYVISLFNNNNFFLFSNVG